MTTITTTICGSRSGYNRHYRLKETPCDSCKVAHKEYYKVWRKNNPETIREMRETYLATHKEHVFEYQKEWAKNNKEKIKSAQQRYSKNNPEKMRNKCRARRARRRDNGFTPYTEEQLFETYGYNCHICSEPIDLEAPRRNNQIGWEKGLHIDHVVPIAKGGSDSLDNVRPSHGGCNLKRGALSSLR